MSFPKRWIVSLALSEIANHQKHCQTFLFMVSLKEYYLFFRIVCRCSLNPAFRDLKRLP